MVFSNYQPACCELAKLQLRVFYIEDNQLRVRTKDQKKKKKKDKVEKRLKTICISKTRQDTKIKMIKLYDDCLIIILEKIFCTDRLPTTIQNDIFTLRKFYQVTLTCTEKAEILEYCAFSHSLWWEDKLENIGTVCLEWDDCLACYRWNEIEEEKKDRKCLFGKIV